LVARSETVGQQHESGNGAVRLNGPARPRIPTTVGNGCVLTWGKNSSSEACECMPESHSVSTKNCEPSAIRRKLPDARSLSSLSGKLPRFAQSRAKNLSCAFVTLRPIFASRSLPFVGTTSEKYRQLRIFVLPTLRGIT
jgi:hypothetical protein